MKRDLSKAQFGYRARKLGFTPEGFLGYWKCPSGIAVSVLNAGSRRRDWLRYLIAKESESAAAELRRLTGCKNFKSNRIGTGEAGTGETPAQPIEQ